MNSETSTIELALAQGVDDDAFVFFRAAQGRVDLIPQSVLERRITALEKSKDFLNLGRLYRELGEFEKAVAATCNGVRAAIRNGNIFTAAFHLKEMVQEGTLDELFVVAMEEARREGDLWWQYRCLQELEWDTEATDFLLQHRSEIENGGEPHFLEVLAIALGDTDQFVALRKDEARSISAKPEPEDGAAK